jgi:hypothetical protein
MCQAAIKVGKIDFGERFLKIYNSSPLAPVRARLEYLAIHSRQDIAELKEAATC